jgi:dCMP deaminase
MKQKFIHAHMKAAEVYAELSSARRLHVGCVIVKNDTIIGIGYNGMPTGWDNNCEDELRWPEFNLPEELQFLKSKPEVLHAETNAIAKVARSTNSSDGAAMFITHAPCLNCAKLIHQSGIKSVFYKTEYRDTNGVDFLKKCNVEVKNVESL